MMNISEYEMYIKIYEVWKHKLCFWNTKVFLSLYKQLSSYTAILIFFFFILFINLWNSLPHSALDSRSVNEIKSLRG